MKKSFAFYLSITLILSQLIFFLLCLVFLFLGYNYADQLWQEQKQKLLQDLALKILLAPANFEKGEVPSSSPFVIYNLQKEIIFTNRPHTYFNLLRNQEKIIPVIADGQTIGYLSYSLGSYAQEEANNTFIQTMTMVMILSLASALLFSLAAFLVFSRLVTQPASLLAKHLVSMSQGDLIKPITLKGPSEIMLIAEKVQELGRELFYQKQSQKRLTADLAHDLRTPLSALKAQFEAMIDGVLKPSPSRLKNILQELNRLETLISDMEELSRLEDVKIKIEKKPIKLKAFIKDLIAPLLDQARLKKIQFTSNIQAEEIWADPKLLARALLNLMNNALQYTPSQGSINLLAYKKEDKIFFSLNNSGPPIPPKDLPFIFQRLYRGDRSRQKPGSGLGLSIAHQIVALHQGSLSVISNAQEGTTFTISLPER